LTYFIILSVVSFILAVVVLVAAVGIVVVANGYWDRRKDDE
jgi:hypothetical protein